MKTKDKKELFNKTEKELRAMFKDAKEELFNLRLEHAQNKLKNKRSIYTKRKEIAKILTVISAISAKEFKNA